MTTQHFKDKDLPSHFSHKSSGFSVFWIVFFSLVFFFFLIFSKWNKIEEFFGFSVENPSVVSDFSFGEEISVEGLLSQDGDFITHTHKLSTLTSGVFGLKSKTVNLNQYSGTILIEGVVDTEYQGLYILEVTRVISQFDTTDPLSGGVETSNLSSGQYYSSLGIYFPSSFFDAYTLVSTGKDSFQLKSLSSSTIISIDYFTCKKGVSNNDCKQLSSTFSSAGEKQFTTSAGVVFYKLAETNSWFFTNSDLFGYFIHGVSEQEVMTLSSFLIFPSVDYLTSQFQSKVSQLCKEGNIAMNELQTLKLSIEQGKILALVLGRWENGTAECKVQIDLSLPLLGTMISFVYKDALLTGTNPVLTGTDLPVSEVQQSQPSVAGLDTKQFPLTLDKPLVFTSSRGHSISFPSGKISYKSNSVSENLGVVGVNCYVATSVIEYSKKDLIDSSPSVMVYECKIKENTVLPYEYYLKPLSDGRVFVVSVLDPAWHDFANNIQVTLN